MSSTVIATPVIELQPLVILSIGKDATILSRHLTTHGVSHAALTRIGTILHALYLLGARQLNGINLLGLSFRQIQGIH